MPSLEVWLFGAAWVSALVLMALALIKLEQWFQK